MKNSDSKLSLSYINSIGNSFLYEFMYRYMYVVE